MTARLFSAVLWLAALSAFQNLSAERMPNIPSLVTNRAEEFLCRAALAVLPFSVVE